MGITTRVLAIAAVAGTLMVGAASFASAGSPDPADARGKCAPGPSVCRPGRYPEVSYQSEGDRQVSDFTMYGSLFLIGAALALAGGLGIFLPPGYRAGVLLALLAGIGVGISGLAVGWPSYSDGASDSFWRVFFVSSIAGFATVSAGLAVVRRRTRPRTVA